MLFLKSDINNTNYIKNAVLGQRFFKYTELIFNNPVGIIVNV